MPVFGSKSRERLQQIHPDLQTIMNELIQVMDVTILCGFRSEEEQNAAYQAGNSKLTWPNSKHNSIPSLAVDVAPYPVDWNDLDSFERMCGIIEGIAQSKGINIRMGRDFSFKDYPHVELV